MGKVARITHEVAEVILEGFRDSPGNASSAARKAGCDSRTARKAWKYGLRTCLSPRFHEPFQLILAREQEEARARIQYEKEEASRLAASAEASRQQDAREKALLDQTQQRVLEEQLIRNARAATSLLLGNVGQISQGITTLGAKVRAALEESAADATKMSLHEVKDVVSMVRGLATSLRQCNEAAQRAMEMSRLLVGEPTSITAVHHLGPMDMEQAKEEIAAAQRALAEVESRKADTAEKGLGSSGTTFN